VSVTLLLRFIYAAYLLLRVDLETRRVRAARLEARLAAHVGI
jgi:hypothetical protein